MVETVEKSRAWPKADNKLSKEIVELLNQSVHAKQVWFFFLYCCLMASNDTIDGDNFHWTFLIVKWYSWRKVQMRQPKHLIVDSQT